MSKEIIYNEEARSKMRAGIDKVANAVKVTLGPKGRNVIIKKNWGGPDITKDGVTVAKEISLKDPYEDIGAQLCKQAASKTNDVVGDGTTTATVLTQAMVNEGMKYITTGANPVAVKRGIDKATAEVVKYISSQKRVIGFENPEDIRHIATISGNDTEVGQIVGDAFTQVGANGVVTFEEGKTTSTSLDVVEGFQIDSGYISPYFVTDTSKMKCEYENCLILLWDRRITNPNEMIPLLNTVAQANKPLLILADDVDAEALAVLALNKHNGVIKVVAVKAPGFGERKKNLMSDIALLTGGTFFSDELGKKLESVSITSLGTAKKVVITKDSTTIIEGAGDKAKVEEHVSMLKTQINEVDSAYDKEKISERIAKLCGAVAIIRVGAAIESEMREKRYRYEDAISATKAALEQGIVPGGATTLYGATAAVEKLVDSLKKTDFDEYAGAMIVLNALEIPLTTILDNAGFPERIRSEIFASVRKGKGYDGRTGKPVSDMFVAGIVDPIKVVQSSIESAAAIAGTFLTAEAVIVDSPDDDSKASANPYAGMY